MPTAQEVIEQKEPEESQDVENVAKGVRESPRQEGHIPKEVVPTPQKTAKQLEPELPNMVETTQQQEQPSSAKKIEVSDVQIQGESVIRLNTRMVVARPNPASYPPHD